MAQHHVSCHGSCPGAKVGSRTETAELQQWLDENPDDYRFPARYSLQQVFFDPERHGDALANRLDDARKELSSGSIAALDAGDPTMLPERLDDTTEDVIGRIFGNAFAASLKDLQADTWSGPIRSDFGEHLVNIEHVEFGRLPTLDEVREQVGRDILRARTEESNQAFYESLRERYTITITAELLSPDARP